MTMRQVNGADARSGRARGRRRPLWAYTGPNGEINPTIHVDKGQPVEIRHVNGAAGDASPARL